VWRRPWGEALPYLAVSVLSLCVTFPPSLGGDWEAPPYCIHYEVRGTSPTSRSGPMVKGGSPGGCLLQDELPWDILVRVAIWLTVRDLGRLASGSRQLARLGDESALWRALFGRAFPCRTALADQPDWRRLLRRNFSMLADNPGDHLWMRVAFGTLTVPVPYVSRADPGALLMELKQLLAPGSGRITGAGEGDVESVCLQRLEASMVGLPLLLLQHGRLVSALGEGEDGWVGRRDVLRAPTPPKTMGQLCLPAVCDVRLSILRPASEQGQRASSAAEARAAAVEESIQSAESAGPSWIVLRVLIPHLGSAQGRPAHAGMDGDPASPCKWGALASSAAGVDVGGGGEGRGCFVWVRGSASVEELCALLETHTGVSRYTHTYTCPGLACIPLDCPSSVHISLEKYFLIVRSILYIGYDIVICRSSVHVPPGATPPCQVHELLPPSTRIVTTKHTNSYPALTVCVCARACLRVLAGGWAYVLGFVVAWVFTGVPGCACVMLYACVCVCVRGRAGGSRERQRLMTPMLHGKEPKIPSAWGANVFNSLL
jgi:hypothetical protein